VCYPLLLEAAAKETLVLQEKKALRFQLFMHKSAMDWIVPSIRMKNYRFQRARRLCNLGAKR
jgi:hypothetical protein